MHFYIMTLFPDMVMNGLNTSITGRAIEKGLLSIDAVNIRDYAYNKHNSVDDYPYGGGAGMLMQAEPVYQTYEAICQKSGKRPRVVYLSPQGRTFCQTMAEEYAREEELVLLCGHYEGIDQRAIDYWGMEEVSIGDYILTGGELPAMVLIDAVARFIPDVLGNSLSTSDESVYSGLLECDQYTKPRTYQNMEVPEVLTGGNHKLIHLWQYENALNLTKQRRPDLWKKYLEAEKNLTKDEKKILEKVAAKPR